MGCPKRQDPLHLTFTGVKAGTYFPGNGGPDGIHYDVKGNLWAGLPGSAALRDRPARHHRRLCADAERRLATTNFAFGGQDNQHLYFEGASTGTFWRFKAPYPGLIGPGGVRLPAQP